MKSLDSQNLTKVSHSINATSLATTPPKQSQTLLVEKISWDEMQMRRAIGLCILFQALPSSRNKSVIQKL
jgi:hypothetical protein